MWRWMFCWLTVWVGCSVHAEKGPALRTVQAPQFVEWGQPATVTASAFDEDGVQSLLVAFGDRTQRINLPRPQPAATFSVSLPADSQGWSELSLTPINTRGERGPTWSTWVATARHDPVSEPDLTPRTFREYAEKWAREGLSPHEQYGRKPEVYKELFKVPLYYVIDWWKEWIENGGAQPYDWQNLCGASNITPYGEVLRCWLEQHPSVGWFMKWADVDPSTGDVVRKPYTDWTITQKVQLEVAFYHAYQWLKNGLGPFGGAVLPDPPNNAVSPTGSEFGASTILMKDDAWALYVQTMAHSLALEIGGFTPWSVLSYLPDHMVTLFDSESMFSVTVGNTYLPNPNNPKVEHFGYRCKGVSHAPPQFVFKFFADANLLQWTHYATISRVLRWTRDNIYHYGGGHDADNMWNHWQYIGAPPVSRIIDGTERISPPSNQQGWILGCHGVAHFYSSVFRTVNIPVVYLYGVGGSGHGTPIFSSIGYTLSHGDDAHSVDFFNLPTMDPPYLPPAKVLIDFDTYNSWFFPHGPDAAARVGRRVSEITQEILPNKLLDLYCDDLQSGVPQQSGTVMDKLNYHYSYNELLNLQLWQRLEAKRIQFNYCGP